MPGLGGRGQELPTEVPGFVNPAHERCAPEGGDMYGGFQALEKPLGVFLT